MNQLIKIHVRTITPPSDDGVDFGEVLSGTQEVWAAIHTTNGSEVFDGTNLLGIATHIFYIRSLTNQTAEDWVEYNGEYYDILNVEDLNEEGRFQALKCNLRGSTSQPVNLA
jgi:SPP1 family predicted phage head-tail adaptor